MDKSQTPLLIALAVILGLFVLLNELSRQDEDEPLPLTGQRRDYMNPYLGIAVELPEFWSFHESLDAQHKQLRTRLDIVDLRSRTEVILRVTEQPWEYLQSLPPRPPDSGDTAMIAGRRGRISRVGTSGLLYATVQQERILVEILGPSPAIDTVVASLRWLSKESKDQASIRFTRVQSPPKSVEQWRSDCQSLDLTAFGSVLHESGITYIYAGSGRRPTGGYSCEITRVVRTGKDDVAVFVEFDRPDLGSVVSQAYTFPSDLVQINERELSARFFGDGNDSPPMISTLKGVEVLEPIYDQSRTIKVFAPSPDSPVGETVRISGIVHGTVERLFVRILDSRENVLAKKSSVVEASGHWSAFSDTLAIALPDQEGEVIHLELYTIDDASGDIVDQIRVPLLAERAH